MFSFITKAKRAPYISPTSIQVRADELCSDVKWFIEEMDCQDKSQVCISHRPDAKTDQEKLFDGVCTLFTGNPSENLLKEYEFNVVNEKFKGRYLYDFFSDLNEKYKLGRARIMRLDPRGCYDFHNDISPFRYHIVLDTNPKAQILFSNDKCIHLPKEDFVYEMATHYEHSAINGGHERRIHILFELFDFNPKNAEFYNTVVDLQKKSHEQLLHYFWSKPVY